MKHNSSRPSGFTLIELVIVVSIIGILSAIAFPSYQEYVVRSNRAMAAACLTEIAQSMERYYSGGLTYNGATLTGGAPTVRTSQCQGDLGGDYVFADPTITNGGQGFTLTAVPENRQLARDGVRCGTLGLSNTGAKTVTGSYGVDYCW